MLNNLPSKTYFKEFRNIEENREYDDESQVDFELSLTEIIAAKFGDHTNTDIPFP